MSGSGGSNVKYTVEIKKSAEREMDRLPEAIHRRLSEKILAAYSSLIREMFKLPCPMPQR